MPPIPGLVEAKPWGNREATTAKTAPETPRDPRRRRRRRRARAGVGVARHQGHPARRRAARDRPRGAVRLRRGRGGAARGRRGRAHELSRRLGRPRRRRDGHDGGRLDGHRRRAARRGRPEAEHREPGAGDDRARAGQAGRGRLEPALVQARLALRDRRRERPRAAHAHGQVPGAPRRRLDPRPERDARLRRPALAARDLHRPAGRRCGPHAWVCGGGRDGGARGRRRDGLDRGRELRRPRMHPGPRGSSSTTCVTSSRAPPSPASRSPRCCMPRRSPSSAKSRSSGSSMPFRPSRRGARSG